MDPEKSELNEKSPSFAGRPLFSMNMASMYMTIKKRWPSPATFFSYQRIKYPANPKAKPTAKLMALTRKKSLRESASKGSIPCPS